MDATEKLASFGPEPEWMGPIDIRGGATAGRPLSKAIWSAALHLVDDVDQKFKETTKDLSTEGRAKHLARTVADARVRLGRLAERRDKLQSDADALRTAPAKGGADTGVLAALWGRLPSDALELTIMHGEALARGDKLTAEAIETLPIAFGHGLGAEAVAGLRRQRIEAEDPAAAAALIVADEAAEAAARAVQGAESHLAALAKDLPAPEPEDGSTTGGDGLRILSPSQVADATKGTNAPREPSGDGLRLVV